MIEKDIINEFYQKVLKSNDILLLTHKSADPDAIGSLLAMYTFLKKINKNPIIIYEDKTPEYLNFVPNINILNSHPKILQNLIITLFNPHAQADEVKYTQSENGKLNIIISTKQGFFSPNDVKINSDYNIDLIIAMDSGDFQVIGEFYDKNMELFEDTFKINIDHHETNSHFGDINIVNTKASSTTEIIYDIISEIDKDLIEEKIATYLLLGIIGDTNSFKNSNTTPKALRISADLIKLGAKQQEIIKHLYRTKKLSTLKIWGKILSNLQEDETYKILWATVPYENFISTNSKEDESKNIMDELLTNAPNIDFFILLREKEPNLISASIRTKNEDIDATVIANKFGGGGHKAACGFTVKNAKLSEIETELINSVRQFQKERLNIDTQNDSNHFDEKRIAKNLKKNLLK